jgi:hypothetical protein
MKKLLCIIMLLLVFVLSSCKDYKQDESGLLEDFPWQQIVLFENDTHVFDVKELFKDYDITISKYKIRLAGSFGEGIIKIDQNKISPLDNGIVKLYIDIHDSNTKTKYTVYFAKVVCVIESSLIEVRTAEDLEKMGIVKHGNYILKNDIDLSGIDFEPIGNSPAGNAFSGMFINLEGYKISNLTITSSENVYLGPYGGVCGGLFGSIEKSFLYGLILENVNIDVSDFAGELYATAGAIAAGLNDSIAINIFASGSINGQDIVGGLYGFANYSLIYNNEFEGTVAGTDKSNNDNDKHVGGLIGWNGHSYVEKCHFKGLLKSEGFVGGIVGYQCGTTKYLVDNSFEATHDNDEVKNEAGTIDEATYGLVNWNMVVVG